MTTGFHRRRGEGHLPIDDFSCVCITTRSKLRKADAYLSSGDHLLRSGRVHHSARDKLERQSNMVQQRRLAIYSRRSRLSRTEVSMYKRQARVYFQNVWNAIAHHADVKPKSSSRPQMSSRPAQPHRTGQAQQPMDYLLGSMVQYGMQASRMPAPRQPTYYAQPSAPPYYAYPSPAPSGYVHATQYARSPARQASYPSPRREEVPKARRRVTFSSPLTETHFITPRATPRALPTPLSPHAAPPTRPNDVPHPHRQHGSSYPYYARA
ncbi:hypothetical protein PUNSTDRAFT_50447 [Punctularia strigosozonata HHB-11173 SS5]|uniref:uncharacterized protein n=1 Tax=Punctularia strigosozonata (strain HHB-11173) TaxID=741275 RepID=UPI0004417D8F|nr:uncharacterized protein PUNSTDRAFT_50447 [Punctularia strigosozonata HHB-11173 SS5]EIN11464.1 hypothetical protein PUNSTDRAFT_50447 [Punctularia strigosozonata HHB-11173 SS5]